MLKAMNVKEKVVELQSEWQNNVINRHNLQECTFHIVVKVIIFHKSIVQDLQ